MVMLFFAFLEMRYNYDIIRFQHFVILAVNLVIPLIVFYIVRPINISVASTGFITAIAPTAVASTVIVSLLNGRVDFAGFSLLLTNFAIALIIPFLLPALINANGEITVGLVILPVISLFLIPISAAILIRKIIPQLGKKLLHIKTLSFYLLAVNIHLGTAKASNYLFNEFDASFNVIIMIGCVSLLLCIVNFNLGKLIGGKEFKLESGQSLGQKNNGFTIWLALTFVSPLAVIGPIFYFLFQNIYISWQLHHHSKSKTSE
jgi:BASS family bile acid:Na+ symporter